MTVINSVATNIVKPLGSKGFPFGSSLSVELGASIEILAVLVPGSAVDDNYAYDSNGTTSDNRAIYVRTTVRPSIDTNLYNIFPNASKDKNISAQATGPTGITWKTDGSMFFICDNHTASIFTYDVPSGQEWNPANASYNSSKSIDLTTALGGGTDDEISGVTFNPTGTKMFVSNWNTTKKIHVFDITAWDPSTASRVVGEELSFTGSIEAREVKFYDNGGVMMVVDSNGKQLLYYNLATPYNPSTGVLNTSRTKTYPSFSDLQGFEFSEEGYRLFLVDGSDKIIRAFDCPAPYIPTTKEVTKEALVTDGVEGFARSIQFSSDYTKLYLTGPEVDFLHTYEKETI